MTHHEEMESAEACLDEDFKTILNAHLITRRDLLKRVKAELLKELDGVTNNCGDMIWSVSEADINAVFSRLIAEATMPGGTNGN